LHRYFDPANKSSWPEAVISALKKTTESKIALGLCLVFLDKLLLADTSVPVASFEWTSLADDESIDLPLKLGHSN
jgi:hypothetical protein